jgi:hypothetical protein
MTSAVFPLKLPQKPVKRSVSYFFDDVETELSAYKIKTMAGKKKKKTRNPITLRRTYLIEYLHSFPPPPPKEKKGCT